MAASVYCSGRGPEFGSQNPESDLKPPINPTPWDLMPSSDFKGKHAHMWFSQTDKHTDRHIDRQIGKTLIHIE